MKKLYIGAFLSLFTTICISQNIQYTQVSPGNLGNTSFLTGVYGSSADFADADADNDLDMIILGSTSDGLKTNLYINDGTGIYTLKPAPFENVWNGAISFADIDNDNDQDVLIGGQSSAGYVCKLYKNDGNANFTEVAGTQFAVAGNAFASAFADIDGDNDMDLLITSHLYKNDGNGNFTEVTETPFDYEIERGTVSFEDADNDSDLDILITGRNNNTAQFISKLYLNDGTGAFTEQTTPFQGVIDGAIAFGDVDGDGDSDLLITGNLQTSYLSAKLYINNGNAIFTEVQGTPFTGVYQASIAFADMDYDNDLDVIIAGKNDADQGITKVLTNDGNGDFSLQSGIVFDGMYRGEIKFADIDNDNDQDLLITGLGPNSTFMAQLFKNTNMLGVNDNPIYGQISLYPNPIKGMVNMDFGELDVQSVQILDMNGRLIYSDDKVNGSTYKVEFNQSPGVYLIEIVSGKEVNQFKFIAN